MRLALLALSFFAQLANAQILVQEPNPKFLTSYFKKIGNAFETNGPISIVVRPCGLENAFWDNNAQITVCQELMENILRKRNNVIQSHAVSPEVASLSATGQILFVVLHELAHALIDRHQIPFSGREEDTADQFAAFILMRTNNTNIYLGATNFFAEPSRMLRIFGKHQLTDEHGLNVQRRAQLVCWGYGRDPHSMQTFARHIGLDQRRMQRCAEEYQQLMQNTPRLFKSAFQGAP